MRERFLALHLPHLGAERWVRLGAAEPAHPLVTVSLAKSGGVVDCASAAAAHAGVRRCMSVADAYAVCGDLVVLPADAIAEDRLLRALGRWGRRRGLAGGAPTADGLLFPLQSGCRSEPQLAALALGAATSAGLTARHGVADTPAAAAILARQADRPRVREGRIAPPGGTGDALAPLPVATLNLGPAAMRRLDRLGVRCIGEIGDWPDPALRRYLGAEVADRMQEALGRPQAVHGAEQVQGVVSFAARPRPQPLPGLA